jgi:non-specific serine/threonine protein kinase
LLPVAGNDSSGTPRGWRRVFSQWLTPRASAEAHREAASGAEAGLPSRVGRYAILRKIGEGGMGIVYAGRDERLARTVAIKTMSSVASDETARQRFWREARTAASVNHPNICQIHEIGEDGGTLFIAMELLEGESLADSLQRGPVRVAEAVPIALGMLAALAALHRNGLVHRDLKPSNVFLTPHGVKLLDFGLARTGPEVSMAATLALTRSGVVIGTPRYMAPEQATGEAVDARTDLFAAGAILFEMLAGRPAFAGETLVDVLHATLHEQPPALTGSPAVAAVDRVIRRALAKRPADRFGSADEIAAELRLVRDADSDDSRAVARALTRIVVLPFRVLRTDPETDFLAVSLPEAIATSLSAVRSLVVRSSAAAARHASEHPDLKALAADADVDRVVMGSLLRAGDQVRATVQLVEAPGGTLLASESINSPLGDLFALQDDIARRVVAALSLPLSGDAMSPRPEAPRNPRAYELYLRGNELARSYLQLPQARDLYQRALELDPQFAPAWAQLGRCHRVIGKFVEEAPDSDQRAKDAFERALALEPRLAVAHKFYATLEADMGRARQALERLLGQAARHGNDPELFAGLVHACRYCGLFEESIAAHAEARRLDPHISTSLEGTLLMTGDLERLLALGAPVSGGGEEELRVIALGLAGRRDEARRLLAGIHSAGLQAFETWMEFLIAWLDRRPDDMAGKLDSISGLKIQEDPEAIFLEGWLFCDAGAYEAGLDHLRRAVGRSYWVAPTLAGSPTFDPLRTHPVFLTVQAEAEAGRQRALTAFREAGGERLLGLQSARGAA